MTLTEMFLSDLELAAQTTRKVLERVPEGQPDWVPHPKSMRLGYLATLVATMPGWIEFMINRDEIDIRPAGGENTLQPKELSTRNELIAALDDSVAKARAALQGTNDEHLMKNWRFLVGGRVVTELPRHINLRDAVFNHLAHHRGQLTVYLRLNDASVPAIYGPSADEGKFN
jgi:uncharacterized damage-inducible protein DinB